MGWVGARGALCTYWTTLHPARRWMFALGVSLQLPAFLPWEERVTSWLQSGQASSLLLAFYSQHLYSASSPSWCLSPSSRLHPAQVPQSPEWVDRTEGYAHCVSFPDSMGNLLCCTYRQ